MSILVTLHDFTDGQEQFLLGRTLADFTKGLPELPATTPATQSAAHGEPVGAAMLREALGFLDPNGAYEQWRDIVAAIGSANCPEAWDIAHKWSEGKLDRSGQYQGASPSRYTGPDAVNKVLETMPPKEGGISVGTIEKLAHDAGWQNTLAPRLRPDYSEVVRKLASDHVEAKPNLFSTREQDKHRPAPQWLVEGLIQENTDVLLASPSKFLKTFTAIDIGCAIATGKKVFGKLAVARPAAVFYGAGEGAHSLASQRITAWEIAHGDGPFSAHRLHVAAAVPMFNNDSGPRFIEDAKAHLKPGERAGLFIRDTLNRSLNGADEDKSSTASADFNMLAAIRGALGCSTLTIHHMGKNLENGPRGSSAFYAGFDTVIMIDKAAKDEATGTYFLTVRVDKQKDGEDGQIFYLHARKVETPNGTSLALYPAAEDDLRRISGKQVGLRVATLVATLVALEAKPDGANAWNGKTGGVLTRTVAIEIALARHAAEGDDLEPSEKEIGVLVADLNKRARFDHAFAAYVVREGRGGRQWAIAPGPAQEEASDE